MHFRPLSEYFNTVAVTKSSAYGQDIFQKSRDQFTAFTATSRVDGIVVARRADSGVSVGQRSWEAGKRTNQGTRQPASASGLFNIVITH